MYITLNSQLELRTISEDDATMTCTARRENLYTFIIVFISEFVQIFSPRPVVFHHNFLFYLICYFNFNLHFANLVLREHRRARRELKQGKHGIRKTKGSFHLIPVDD